jgi:glycosyltransferase involved in cell wall biosynthesis
MDVGYGGAMKKILWVVDVPGWAFDIQVQAIKERLKGFHIDICYDITLHGVHTKQYDFIHYANWMDGTKWPQQCSAGVCSHNWHLKWMKRAKEKMPKFKKLVCISKILRDKLGDINKNIHYIPNGVDTDMFGYNYNSHNDFTVGFVGQKTSGGFGKGRNSEGIPVWDIKGYELVLKPLIKRLEGKVRLKILDNDSTNAIPYSEMPAWYKGIDVLICTSLWEGCPLPVLEAASSGKAVIATKVGICPELIQNGVNGYLIEPPRKPSDIPAALEQFEKYILMLSNNWSLCNEMGLANRNMVMKYGWRNVIPKWKDFFNV